jgi:hypothetical protein
MKHKYDKRGAGAEGKFAENLFREVCRLYKQNFLNSSLKEDCAGIDGYLDGRPLDVKARKNRIPPNTSWLELAKANGSIGSGWGFKDKLIAQLMPYEESKFIIKAQFGIYHTKDLRKLITKVIDLNEVSKKGELYKIYTRPPEEKTETHRGILTVVTYEDLENLESFIPMLIPKDLINSIKIEYGYLGIR